MNPSSTPRNVVSLLLTPLVLLSFALVLSLPSARAADASWAVNADGAWSLGTNWTGSSAPGTTSGTNSPDTATFGNVLTADRVVTVDANRNIFAIDFTGGNPSGIDYTLSGGNLLLSNGGHVLTSGGGGDRPGHHFRADRNPRRWRQCQLYG